MDQLPPLYKNLYRIGEVSKLVGVEQHVLRFWESQFTHYITLPRSKKGFRLYSQRAVAMFWLIRHLLRVELYTIAGAERQLARLHPEARLKSVS